MCGGIEPETAISDLPGACLVKGDEEFEEQEKDEGTYDVRYPTQTHRALLLRRINAAMNR